MTIPHYKHRQRPGFPAGGGSGIYGLAFIGAAAYYLQNARNFQEGLWRLLKALVWPALLVYKALESLQM